MLLEEDLVKLLGDLLVHVEGWAGVAVVEVVSKLCQQRVCWGGEEH